MKLTLTFNMDDPYDNKQGKRSMFADDLVDALNTIGLELRNHDRYMDHPPEVHEFVCSLRERYYEIIDNLGSLLED